jgi:hypothetical protein
MNEQCFKFNFITNRFQLFDKVNPFDCLFRSRGWATVKKAVFSEE